MAATPTKAKSLLEIQAEFEEIRSLNKPGSMYHFVAGEILATIDATLDQILAHMDADHPVERDLWNRFAAALGVRGK